MHKIRPLWRFIFGAILLVTTVWNSSTMDGTYRGFFNFAIFAAATITWVVLCIGIKYDDPLRGIYEKISEAEEKSAAVGMGTGAGENVRSATVSAAADPELVSVLKDISVSLAKIASELEDKK